MGTCRSYDLVLGFSFSKKDFLPLCSKEPEKSHIEDRFDSKTGKQTGIAVVVDRPAGYVYSGFGKTFFLSNSNASSYYDDDDIVLLTKAISKAAKCKAVVALNDSEEIVFYIPLKNGKDTVDHAHLSVTGQLDVDKIVKNRKRLSQIRKFLANLGLKPKKAGVHIVYFAM